jgi:hypothetical protein
MLEYNISILFIFRIRNIEVIQFMILFINNKKKIKVYFYVIDINNNSICLGNKHEI